MKARLPTLAGLRQSQLRHTPMVSPDPDVEHHACRSSPRSSLIIPAVVLCPRELELIDAAVALQRDLFGFMASFGPRRG